MALSSNFPVYQSEPIPVNFAGFYSNTLLLGQMGWNLALDEHGGYRDPFGGRARAVLHHKQLALSMVGELYGVDKLHRGRQDMFERGSMFPGSHEQRDGFERACFKDGPRIEIRSAGSRGHVIIQMMEPLRAMSWRETDPQFTTVDTRRELHELPLFAELFKAQPASQELIVEPQDVQALLDQILAVQGPQRRAIRARDRQREDAGASAPRQVHAQIVSLHAA